MTDFTTVKKNLESKRFRVSAFATAEEAADYLDRSIDGVSVGIGGSVTAEQMGLYEKLSGHNRVFWHWRPESAEDPRREAMTADMYSTSVNGKMCIRDRAMAARWILWPPAFCPCLWDRLPVP